MAKSGFTRILVPLQARARISGVVEVKKLGPLVKDPSSKLSRLAVNGQVLARTRYSHRGTSRQPRGSQEGTETCAAAEGGGCRLLGNALSNTAGLRRHHPGGEPEGVGGPGPASRYTVGLQRESHYRYEERNGELGFALSYTVGLRLEPPAQTPLQFPALGTALGCKVGLRGT